MMHAPQELSWTTLLLSCAVTSAATTLALTLALRKSQQPQPQPQQTHLKHKTGSKQPPPQKPVLDLRRLASNDVPPALRVDAYFSKEHIQAFVHRALFDNCASVFDVLDAIHPYVENFFRERVWENDSPQHQHLTILTASDQCNTEGYYSTKDGNKEDETRRWRVPAWIDPTHATEIMLFPGVDPCTFRPDKIINLSSTTKYIVVLPGARVLGGVLNVSHGSIYIGSGVSIEPFTVLQGPCIVGDDSIIRSGAYVRGDVLIGKRVVLRGELKNALVMDQAELGHPGYCGDSLCGFKSHFGNQVTTANFPLFSHREIMVEVDDKRYSTGRRKMGVVLGDYGQLGCSTVTDPCTLVRPYTVVYPLTRLPKGIYGPNVIVKNKPLEKGVLEIVPLMSAGEEKKPEHGG